MKKGYVSSWMYLQRWSKSTISFICLVLWLSHLFSNVEVVFVVRVPGKMVIRGGHVINAVPFDQSWQMAFYLLFFRCMGQATLKVYGLQVRIFFGWRTDPIFALCWLIGRHWSTVTPNMEPVKVASGFRRVSVCWFTMSCWQSVAWQNCDCHFVLAWLY